MINAMIEVPAITILDRKYGEEKADQIMQAFMDTYGIKGNAHLMSIESDEDLELVKDEYPGCF